MARRRFLVAYDISDPVRLRRVCSVMEAHGERLQYSVFLCDLGPAERVEMEARVTSIMDLTSDSVVEIDLGPVDRPANIRTLGKRRNLPNSGPQIV
jgi:CRISPR-associated protein Cas2